jgi:hypothetical protein
MESLPSDMMGKFHLEYHAKWYQRRQEIETARHINVMPDPTLQLQPTPVSLPRLLIVNQENKRGVSVSSTSTNDQRDSSATEGSGSIVEKKLEPLPHDYEPHENAVLCGRGRIFKEASGNLRLQSICNTFLQEYSRDTSKKEKSEIVFNIMEMIRASCAPSEGFVRFHEDRWWEVDAAFVRNKVTGVLRDSLSSKYPSKYKSTTQAKVAKRRMQNILSSVGDQKGLEENVQQRLPSDYVSENDYSRDFDSYDSIFESIG